MTAGIITALSAEARCLTRQAINPRIPVRINSELICMISGMGASQAASAAQSLIKERISALISWGTAAALDQSLQNGDLVIPEYVYPVASGTLETDRNWGQQLYQFMNNNNIPFMNGPLAECDKVLTTSAEKSELYNKTGAMIADMETAAILRAANSAKIPCIAIRVVVDTANTDLPQSILKYVDAYGEPQIPQIMLELARSPSLLIQCINLWLAMRHSIRVLSRIAKISNQVLVYRGH